MHPLVKARNAAREAAHELRRAADEELDARLRAGFDPARLRPATPADVRAGAVLWHRQAIAGGPGASYAWSVVAEAVDPMGGGFMDEDGCCHPFLDNWHVLQEAPPAVPHPAEAILAEDVRGTAREAWLLDTGQFVLPGDALPAWATSLGWRRLMRQRRALRMFVPEGELPRLPALAHAFHVLKRGYEMSDALRRHREWQAGLDALRAAGAPADEVEAHAARELDVLRAAVRTAGAHARILDEEAPERRSPFRTVPYAPPAPVKPDAKAPPKPAGRERDARGKAG